MESNKKEKKNYHILVIGMIVCIGVIVFALYKLVPTLNDYRQSESAYDDLKEQIISRPDQMPEDDANESAKEDHGWWDDMPDIDFDALAAINPDVVGWILFDDTDTIPVDYPILHAQDNDTYLHTNLYGEHFAAGSIFLESANAPDFSDCYNIIYGHNMKNGSMFGSLKRYKREESFYEDNRYFTIFTKDAMYRYEIFSYEDIANDSVIYTVGYQPDEEYQRLIDYMVDGSIKNTGIYPSRENRIITLSTCSTAGDSVRFAVHAVLVDQRSVD